MFGPLVCIRHNDAWFRVVFRTGVQNLGSEVNRDLK